MKTDRGLTFGEIAHDYDRHRPDAPASAVDWLFPGGGGTVVDLAAGTGAMTRTLLGRFDHVIAIEPDPRMLAVLASRCPEARALAGLAESLPLDDESVDGVVVAMAWHWIDQSRAMPEISRVLRRGGTFGVVWYHRDLSVSWVAELDRFTRGVRARISGGGQPRAAREDVLDPSPGPLFGPVRERHFGWQIAMTASELVGHLATDASAIAMDREARRRVDKIVLGYLREELGLEGDRKLDLPMDCRCLCTKKVDVDASSDVHGGNDDYKASP